MALARGLSRELRALQHGWGSMASSGAGGLSGGLLNAMSQTLSRVASLSPIGVGARAADAAAGPGKNINWTDLRSRVLLRMQTAQGLPQLMNFHALRNRTVAYDVDTSRAVAHEITGHSP